MEGERKSLDRDRLRHEAEDRVGRGEISDVDELSDADVRALLHELQVHQIELEMQNEELLQAKTEAEDALRKYSDLYDFAPVGYLTLDKDALVLEANLTAATMLGMPRSELVRTPFRLFVAPESRPVFDGFRGSILDTGGRGSRELTLLKGGKEPFCALVDATITAEFGAWRITIIDITRRREAEDTFHRAYSELAEARAEADRRTAELQVLMEAVPTGVFIAHDPVARVITANRAGRELLGVPADANVSKSAPEEEWPTTWQEMRDGVPIPPEQLPAQQAARGIELRDYEMDLVFTNGTSKNILAYAAPLWDEGGKPRGSVTVLLDITRRKSAEKELATARAEADRRAAEMESFIASMADGVIIFDSQGQVVFINDIGMDILGVPLGESITDLMERSRVYDLERNPVPHGEEAVRLALRGETVNDRRGVLVTPWGKEITMSVSSAPVLSGEGEVIGATVVFRDVSARVSFERERQALLERERHIAEILEQTVLPHGDYDLPGCSVAVRYEPALAEAGVGGDFYDVFELDDDKVGVLIGDVAGKGLASAVGIAAMRYSIRSYAYLDPRPSRVMTLANQALCRSETGRDDFGMLTAFFAVIDTRFGGISYASGGHEAALLKTSDGDIEMLEAHGPALGVIDEIEYDEQGRKLQPGDVVVMVTDGITEARPDSVSLFGIEGVERYLAGSSEENLDAIAQGILWAAKDHAGGCFTDDAAIVVISLENRPSRGSGNE